ncbi:MAG: GDCCVxC domain-containing (seleno)protein [Rudaea sp.]
MTALVLQTLITCPRCGTSTVEIMPITARRLFYECTHCHALLQPRDDDCCVFCSYGSVKCPFVQEQTSQG